MIIDYTYTIVEALEVHQYFRVEYRSEGRETVIRNLQSDNFSSEYLNERCVRSAPIELWKYQENVIASPTMTEVVVGQTVAIKFEDISFPTSEELDVINAGIAEWVAAGNDPDDYVQPE